MQNASHFTQNSIGVIDIIIPFFSISHFTQGGTLNFWYPSIIYVFSTFREKNRQAKLIIKMQGATTSITNPAAPSK